MKTVQASRVIPLRQQWVWHYVSDVMRWSLFLPFEEVWRLELDRFQVALSVPPIQSFDQPIQPMARKAVVCRLHILSREPCERLEWRTSEPFPAQGMILVERLGFRSRITVQFGLETKAKPAIPGFEQLQGLQDLLEQGLDRLVVHLSDHGTPSQPDPRMALEAKLIRSLLVNPGLGKS